MEVANFATAAGGFATIVDDRADAESMPLVPDKMVPAPRGISSGSSLSSSSQPDDHYTIQLLKSGGTYGIAYRIFPSEGMFITGICPGSTVSEWNKYCESIDDIVCVGDSVESVNGVTDIQEMLEQLMTEKEITARLKRCGPRWYLAHMPWHEGAGGEAGRELPYERESDRALQLQIAYEIAQSPTLGSASLVAPAEPQEPLTPLQRKDILTMVFLCVVPNLFAVVFFSDMFIGLAIPKAFADEVWNFRGNSLIGFGVMLASLLYILDWSKFQRDTSKMVSAFVVVYMVYFGWFVKIRSYPSAPLVLTMLHVPVFLGLHRVSTSATHERRSFYTVAGIITGAIGVFTFGLWLLWMNAGFWNGTHRYDDSTRSRLIEDSSAIYDSWLITIERPDETTYERPIDYDWDCHPDDKRDYDYVVVDGEKVEASYKLGVQERLSRAESCASARTLWFIFWLSPFIIACVCFVESLFCVINGVFLDTSTISTMEKVVKQFILMICLLLMFMWVSASIAGASLRLTSTLMAFAGSGLLILFTWMYFEIGRSNISTQLQQSRVMQSILALVTSDWVRGAIVIALNGLIPAFLLLNFLNQKMRRMRGTSESSSLFTRKTRGVLESIAQWNWSSILTKANWLSILYWVMMIGVAKITFVFLSWLNETLSTVPLLWVLCAFFLIGFTMFMLPPVPGVPVYITAGIIVAARGESTAGVGFGGGLGLAILLSFLLKLLASSGQYMIGYLLGKSVKVQQLVGVDKVIIRAVEKILQTKGLNVPKVAVLIGGPDWPTSVICGILKLNLFQVLLGTAPVILVSTPCVVAGALLVYPNESGILETMASTMLLLSGAGQMACMGLAAYYIQECVHAYGDELSKPRPEHAAIAALTAKEARYNECYRVATHFWSFSPPRQVMVIMSTALMISAMFFFQFMGPSCFRNFELDDRICDSYEEGGLDCKVVSLVLPIGWLALGLFSAACVLHVVFLRGASLEAQRSLLAQDSGEGYEDQMQKVRKIFAGTSKHSGDINSRRPGAVSSDTMTS